MLRAHAPLPEPATRTARAARLLLLVTGMALGIAFLFALLDAERAASASSRLRAALSYIAPVGSLAAIFGALRLGDRAVRVAAAAVLAVVACLFATEVGVALVWFARAAGNGPFDGRDRVEVIDDLHASGVDAVPAIEPKSVLAAAVDGSLRARTRDGDAELQILSGIAHRHTLVCNETGQWVTYMSDRYGMNNPDSVWNAAATPIAIVGDAFANGWCAPPEVHFSGLLRRREPDLINVGQSGNGPLLGLASLVEYLPGRRPQAVLWFFYELNDLEDLATESRSALLRRYLETGFAANLIDRQEAVDRAVADHLATTAASWRRFGNLQSGPIDFVAALSLVRSMAKLPRARRFWGLTYRPAETPPDYGLMQQVLSRARSEVGRWNGGLVLVYLPAAPRYMTFASPGGRYEDRRRRIRSLAENLGIPVVDVHEAFAAHGRPLSLFHPIAGGEYGHYTAVGHRLVAEAVANYLEATAR